MPDRPAVQPNDAPDVNASIHAYYLSLPNRDEAGLAAVLRDPRKYNYVWRHMLRYACGQSTLEVNDTPPPVVLRTLVPLPAPTAETGTTRECENA